MFTKLVRLTRDAETRVNASTQKSSIQISAAYNVGYGEKSEGVFLSGNYYGSDGILPYLKKGSQVVLTMDDVKPYHNHKDGKDYTGFYCVVRGIELTFSGKAEDKQEKPKQAKQVEDDFEDSIPF